MSSYRMKYKIGLVEHSVVVPEDISSIPLGTILPYSANTMNPPAGFLFCDGSAVSRSMYPDLFELLGTLYGEGDGSTTFNLPNLLGGRFLEGSSAAGTSKEAGLPNITGSITARFSSSGYYVGFAGKDAFYSYGSQGHNATATTGNTGSGFLQHLVLDASSSSSVYKNDVTTVQPSSLTVRYIIKAFNAVSHDSELIDITQYASALNQKYDVGSDWCYIYPNGGIASNPADVVYNNRYIETNPFPGYLVGCIAEIFYNGAWGTSGWYTYFKDGEGYNAIGVSASQFDSNSIVVQTGLNYILHSGYLGGGNIGKVTGSTAPTSLPCRVKVWKIGKLPS